MRPIGIFWLGSIWLLLGMSLPAGAQTIRVLLVGDSWAEQMWTNQSLSTVFANEGHSEILDKGDVTALGGSTAAEWATPAWLELITDEMAAHPTIDVIHLSIGGNDFLAGQVGGGWYAGIPTGDWSGLQDQIAADVAVVIDHILSLDPAIEVVLSSYDYTNFEASLAGPPTITCQVEAFNLGDPTPEEINTAALGLEEHLRLHVLDSRPRARGVVHYGWMQFTYGFPGMGIAPGDLLPPGDPTLPSPVEAMRNGDDCFHLTPAGYLVLAQNLWDEAYQMLLLGGIFADGFETGDLESWSASIPGDYEARSLRDTA